MTLVIFVLILNMFGYVLNTYGSDLMPIRHPYFYTYQFSPVAHNFPSLALFSRVAHNFPSLALYPYGATEAFVFAVPYDNISDISEFYKPHIIYI